MTWKEDRERLFPKEILSFAQHVERNYGIAACITLAQWAVESNYGKRMIGKANPFGIKWRPSCGFPSLDVTTHEYINGERVKVVDKFIDFPTLEAAFDYRGKLLTRTAGPYGHCNAMIGVGWPAHLACIAKTYATDPHYARTLSEVISLYHLYDFNLPKSH